MGAMPTDLDLLAAAETARGRAYAPYSRFLVGAALLDAEGAIHPGCNVENASYPAGLCAERVALGGAVARGARRFLAIAVAGPEGVAITPCGICRQVLSEFSPGGALRVIARGADGAPRGTTIAALLPGAFGPAQLDRR
jgi:cytidine deaminase